MSQVYQNEPRVSKVSWARKVLNREVKYGSPVVIICGNMKGRIIPVHCKLTAILSAQ